MHGYNRKNVISFFAHFSSWNNWGKIFRRWGLRPYWPQSGICLTLFPASLGYTTEKSLEHTSISRFQYSSFRFVLLCFGLVWFVLFHFTLLCYVLFYFVSFYLIFTLICYFYPLISQVSPSLFPTSFTATSILPFTLLCSFSADIVWSPYNFLKLSPLLFSVCFKNLVSALTQLLCVCHIRAREFFNFTHCSARMLSLRAFSINHISTMALCTHCQTY